MLMGKNLQRDKEVKDTWVRDLKWNEDLEKLNRVGPPSRGNAMAFELRRKTPFDLKGKKMYRYMLVCIFDWCEGEKKGGEETSWWFCPENVELTRWSLDLMPSGGSWVSSINCCRKQQKAKSFHPQNIYFFS